MIQQAMEGTARERLVLAARALFACKGFHSSAMAELAASARVSVGQVYRLFENKDDVIAAIVQEESAVRRQELVALCERLEAGEILVTAAFEELARHALTGKEEGLTFEILAEAHRNPRVAATIGGLCDGFRDVIRRLARAAHPEFGAAQLDASEEFLLACMFGLGNRAFSCPKLPVDEAAVQAGRMMMGALDALGR